MESTVTFKQMHAQFPGRKTLETYKDVELNSEGIKMTLVKSFTTASQANQWGVVGILMNKLFTKAMKAETMEFDFHNVKKAELSNKKIMGKQIHNLMLWNCSAAVASYQNIDCILSLEANQLDKVKACLAPVIERSVYSEIDV